ncbi:alanine dehydrogenase [Flavobacterium psychrophilum]|uniref:alanine dehydrogenase n=3 Tax=Flavobacterium psychrophilum TaxID=96345 RepID=A6GYI9_FLAPJ|nr:alanine dehydrogenase [Flavobacterium psychrophilum]AIG29877.1 alanine dehydrogenase [Flavobacterium psychrophilum]AIG32154.1 alanine dehydrogenase [Flavobacterium psychrophilum]AIG34309.1 alanine dehydrogenase [Flavobacterium psychrophilum]AIG36672.1 alanine dehydrogenase [Flavobacterium psychrophilum]AIG38937.1 alanine dehydrogenase [Flavobacterium psychrophilum]
MTITPFSKQDLLPQEEKLEIAKHKSELFIGIPKETSYQERRICLTPDAVNAMTAQGHRVLIEAGAGENSSYSDKNYSDAGAEITNDTKKVLACPMILKVEPATLVEIEMMHPKTIIISAIQLKTRKKEYFEALQKKKITALAFEYIKDEDGSFPAVKSLSEIAGTASVLVAAELLTASKFGNGLLFGNITGVPPTEVVILGAGTVAEFAARTAIGLGASVKVFDNSITKLRRLQNNLNQRIFTSTIQNKTLLKSLQRCDVAIGAIRGKYRAPIVVSQTMVEHMKKGSVIIDVSIDTGGCFETSEITTHENPTFIKNGIIHYCVPNIPSRYSKTASLSISNIITPYLLQIADDGGIESAIRCDSGLKNGVYFYHGILTNKTIGEWFNLNHRDINLIVF